MYSSVTHCRLCNPTNMLRQALVCLCARFLISKGNHMCSYLQKDLIVCYLSLIWLHVERPANASIKTQLRGRYAARCIKVVSCGSCLLPTLRRCNAGPDQLGRSAACASVAARRKWRATVWP